MINDFKILLNQIKVLLPYKLYCFCFMLVVTHEYTRGSCEQQRYDRQKLIMKCSCNVKLTRAQNSVKTAEEWRRGAKLGQVGYSYGFALIVGVTL